LASFFKTQENKGFTLIEVLGVVILLSIIFGISFLTFKPKVFRLKAAAYQVTQDLQSTYMKTINTGILHRVEFKNDKRSYVIQEFEPPKKKPELPEEGETEAYRNELKEWEEAQRKIDSLSATDRAELTRYQRGSFINVKEVQLSSPIVFEIIYTLKDLAADELLNILFYPSGEVEEALIILDAGDEKYMSLQINPLSGKVTSRKGRNAEEEWKKRSRAD